MKKILTTLVAITFCLYAHAQKCKFDYEETDPFTGKYKAGISSVISKSWKIGFNRENDAYSIGLVINFPGSKKDIIEINDTLLIAIDKNEPLVFKALNRALPTSNVVGQGAYAQIQTFYQVFYQATPEQIELLSKFNPIATRVYFGHTFYSVEINNKNSQKISRAAECIIQ
nr:hypothetical protein [uncultured Carboxylicivirga sp.]